MVHGDLDLRFKLTGAEQPHSVLRSPHDARRDKRFKINGLGRIDLAGIDRLLQAAEAQLIPLFPLPLVEAALRQAPVKRHLAAFEAADAHASARFLPLHTAPGGLPDARAYTPAATNAALVR